MNNSQPTEPGGGSPDGAPPPRWIGAESAPEPPERPRLSGPFGLDALRREQKAEPVKPSRNHLRLVPPSEPEPPSEPAAAPPTVPEPTAAPPVVTAPAPALTAPVESPAPATRPARILPELGALAGTVLIGTAAALGVDAIIGVLNGLPPAYLLVFLASPIWDLLPRRLPARLAAVAVDAAATIGVWFLVAAVPMQRWVDVQRSYWRAELSFGIACLLVGAVHLVLALRRRAVP
ncbi:MAG TPA: hypothetical protein VHC49_11475 [Mycobacteriales bacterium]|nr:hypothetical protein [Mycobacteriales bacterium]